MKTATPHTPSLTHPQGAAFFSKPLLCFLVLHGTQGGERDWVPPSGWQETRLSKRQDRAGRGRGRGASPEQVLKNMLAEPETF